MYHMFHFLSSQMEKYSKHLESIVAERTQDLVVEKQKTDRLLYSKSGVLRLHHLVLHYKHYLCFMYVGSLTPSPLTTYHCILFLIFIDMLHVVLSILELLIRENNCIRNTLVLFSYLFGT